MPSISRIRITNLVYENGAKRYRDEIFHFDSHNGVILLENGGGKTVFVQAVLQTILPHTPLADRKAKDTFSLDNSPAHLAVEWLLNDRPRRYALTAVTVFRNKEGMDSYKYVYEYESGDEHSLEGLPFVREGQDGRQRPASKEEMADYYQYMSHSYLSAHYFSSNREYQAYIEENFKIINSEWRSVARINSAEGEIEGFFEGCRTTTQLVDQLLIPTVEEALAGNGAQDFVETFERQREHFKKHRQLRDKIEESQRVDTQITSYVERYSDYEEARQALLKAKGEAKSLHQLAVEEQQQLRQRAEEHRQNSERLLEQSRELERRQASCQLASLQQKMERAGEVYAQQREAYDGRQEEYAAKDGRLQNLEIARLKARIRSSEEEIQYYTEQIERLTSDPDVEDLESRIKNNAGFLRWAYLQEEDVLVGRQQEMQQEQDKLEHDIQAIEEQYKAEQSNYQELLVKKGQAELRRDQAEKDMLTIASQILANPQQEEVRQEKQKWEQHASELERDRQENQSLLRQLLDEKGRLQGELGQLRPALQTYSREEQSLQDLLQHIQEEHERLLLSMKELDPAFYSVQSIYTKQSTVVTQLEGAAENLRLHKERAILKESQALAMYKFYESSTYYSADPLLEAWIDEWREQFSYLEAGAVYVEKAARQLARSESEYFTIYPFWAISLICRSSELERLLARLRKQAGMMTHPVFVLTQEQARAILDSLGGDSRPLMETAQKVFPSGWEVNLSAGVFQSWQQELAKKAREYGYERQQQEEQLQLILEFMKQLQRFLEKYPYEETRQMQQSWREIKEQLVETDQQIRARQERVDEIDVRLNGLGKKITEMIEELAHLSNRILKAHDYLLKAGERDKARLDLQQFQELLPFREQELVRIANQKKQAERKLQEIRQSLTMVKQELLHLQKQVLYQAVAGEVPQISSRGRELLESERQDLMDALHQKQKGRQSLEERLRQARLSKNNDENELTRRIRQCEAEIEKDFIFPPGGDEEIDVLISQINDLKKLLKRLEPGLKQAEKNHDIAQDRFTRQEADFYQEYSERIYFSTSLLVVKEELEIEREEIRLKQNYLQEQSLVLNREKELIDQALAELERKNERYEFLQENIICVELPSAVGQDFRYQPKQIIDRYVQTLQDRQAALDQLREGLEKERERLELFCQEELRDPKLRRMVVAGLKFREDYQEVLEWKSRLSNRIALAIRHAEDDMREHDRELQQFINHLHTYLLTMAGELRLIPRKTRIRIEDGWKEIFQFDVPDWDEKEGKNELRRHVDWMIAQIESSRYQDENGIENYALMHKDIEKWLQPQQLLRNVMKEKNIKVKCRKVTGDGKISSYPSTWESSNQWSGGEKWSKNMALFLGIQNYLAEKRQAVNPRVKRNCTVILDNPFGKASSDHVLDPVFFIAEKLGFQIIALTALAEGKFIRDYFPIVYSCRLRPTTSPDKYLISTEKEIRHAYFQDHDPEALRRLGQQKQMELF